MYLQLNKFNYVPYILQPLIAVVHQVHDLLHPLNGFAHTSNVHGGRPPQVRSRQSLHRRRHRCREHDRLLGKQQTVLIISIFTLKNIPNTEIGYL